MSRESMRSRINQGLNNGPENESARNSITSLYTSLTSNHGKDAILDYLNRETGVNKNIIEGWITTRIRHLNTGIVNKIVSSLRSFKPEYLKGTPQRLVPPIKNYPSRESTTNTP